MEEVRIDVNNQSPDRIAEAKRCADLCFRINQTNPTNPKIKDLFDELFNHTLGEGTVISFILFLRTKSKSGKMLFL